MWTLYALLSHRGAVHGDMLEAYSWGREFQLGYFKHPPFWAWIAGAWFEVFPRTTWAFYLLATLNSGIGIVGAWRLNGLLARGIDRFNATALLLLYAAYTLQGHQFNANLILISLWPWTVYAFVASMEKRSAAAAALLGVLAAACLLSKYYSVLLLLSCAAASFAHPDWRRYYRSAAPYISVGVCLALLAPHLWWIVHSGFPTLKYVASKTGFPSTRVYTNMVTFALGCAGLNLAATALVAASRPWRQSPPASGPLADDHVDFVAILALGPFILTLLCAALGHFRISTNFASPIFFLMPLLLIQLLRPEPVRLRRLTIMAVATLCAAAILIAPAVPTLEGRTTAKPAIQAAHEAVRIWREATHRPLRIVAGTSPYAGATVFYGGDDTSAFADFDQQHTPWVSEARIARDGLLAMCRTNDEKCLTGAAQLAGPRQEIELSVPAEAGPPVDLRLILFPPRPGG
jgi:4-amino-4-deoxy-L-arabinose transferase-like glycosyltransferase